jgi:hypothetical protein
MTEPRRQTAFLRDMANLMKVAGIVIQLTFSVPKLTHYSPM